jgi:hypothetical protein
MIQVLWEDKFNRPEKMTGKIPLVGGCSKVYQRVSHVANPGDYIDG